MARQAQPVEINNFVKGLITEASPLTFPENASLDEDNFVLKRDGTRERRFGMDFEAGFQKVSTGITSLPAGELAFSAFNWKNVGGNANKTFSVVQTGNVVKFFDVDSRPLSSGLVYTKTFASSSELQVFSYAIVDGILVIVTGEKTVYTFQYDGSSISESTLILKTRDLFGLEDRINGEDLTQGTGLLERPTVIEDSHIYNLRNQTWAVPREKGDSDTAKIDPLTWFYTRSDNEYPANSDSVNFALYADPSDDANRTGDQFFAKDLINNPQGTGPAPKGFFIIDALERGTSRQDEVAKVYQKYPELNYPIASIPADRTPGGAKCVSEYSGRIWYAGFSGEVIGGDEKSPKLSSYVFYSQLVQDLSDIGSCYQEGDPTSKDAPDIVETDGGFLRIDGAYNIQKLVNVGSGLLVIAENGVWMVSGGSDYGFSATNNMRRKLSEHGANSPGSVVVVDNTVFYWADDAIYQIAPDKFGDYSSQNVTQQTIQTFYDNISPIDKLYAQGSYDSYDRKIRWVYQNRLQSTAPSKELIFDVTLGAFYTSTIQSVGGSLYPKVAAAIQIPPYRLTEEQVDIIYDDTLVLYNGEQVTYPQEVRGQGTRELVYLAITDLEPLEYTFSLYNNASFKDWERVDGVGTDALAYLVTGYLAGGDYMRSKQVPYIFFHLIRTEDGFLEDETGNLFPTNESSCKVQAQWDWTNSAASNRWGREFEAYRYRRLYSPVNSEDNFDTGRRVLTTKNKLRGHGKVLSLMISTSPGKDCRLLGWSMVVDMAQNV